MKAMMISMMVMRVIPERCYMRVVCDYDVFKEVMDDLGKGVGWIGA